MDDGTVNYIRNSVKVVIDAYNGSMDFYVVDPKDPVIATYRRIFPDLFKDGARCRPRCRRTSAIRRACSTSRRSMYDTFHMTDPQVFYNRDDAWRVPVRQSDRYQRAAGSLLHDDAPAGRDRRTSSC